MIDSSNAVADGDATVVHSISHGDTDAAGAVNNDTNVIYFTDTDNNAFNDFTFSFELDAVARNDADGIIAVFYDTDGGFANIGVLTDTSSDADGTFNNASAMFTSYARAAMSATDYGDLSAANFAIQA